jgi:hypothetical protein
MHIIVLNVERKGLDILTWALCCSVLLMRSNWHKIKLLIIYFHLLLESYIIKAKFHDPFFWHVLSWEFLCKFVSCFVFMLYSKIYIFCVIWSSCKRIWVVHCLIILHSTSLFFVLLDIHLAQQFCVWGQKHSFFTCDDWKVIIWKDKYKKVPIWNGLLGFKV